MSINSVVNDTVTGESVINALKPKPPTISGYAISGVDDTALDPSGGQTILLNGTGFQRGATVTLNGSAIAVVTYVNANQLSFTSPAQSAGTYTIYAVNADGGTGIYIPGLIYSNLPTWTTGAGSLGTYYETQTLASNVVASGDAPITYSLFSGALPTGAVFNANGTISGTAPADSGSTTYSFTVQATDAQLQDSTRSFTLTINTDVVSWTTPNASATYTPTVNSVMANIGLTATSAAGSAVTYSANSLPTGVSLSGNTISGTPSAAGSTSTLLTATATATSRSATRTINWTIAVAADTYFKNTTLLLPGASTSFVKDASSNNFAVTIAGDTKPNNFNPYTPGYYSNYFDGSGDDISVPSASNLIFGTGDLTVECWINPGSQLGTYNTIIGGDTTGAFLLTITGSGTSTSITINAYGSAGVYTQSYTFTPGVWYHIAATRSGTNLKVFINGTQLGSTVTDSTNYSAASRIIGGAGSVAGQYYLGYVSNARLVKGTAVYTANFTPPTTPLTAIANTSLLTCQSNRFIDNSTNNFTITVNGNTSISSFDPFVPNSSYSTYGSGYFDGTGDYLITPTDTAFTFGTGDFTIECWVYLTNSSATTQTIMGADLSVSTGSIQVWYNNTANKITFNVYGNPQFVSSSTVSVGNWIHLAFTRSSGTFNMFINGTQSASGSMTNNLPNNKFVIGRGYATIDAEYSYGYINDVRVVKGTAVYTTAFTPPTSPLTAIANTSLLTLQNNQSVNNNVFLDNSTNNFFVTRNGNTTQGTFSPYGANWSNYFTGSSYLNLPSSSALSLGTGDFCIEGWLNVSSASTVNTFIQTNWAGAGAGSSFAIWHNVSGYANKIYVASWSYNSGAPLMVSTTQLTIGQWYHIAVTRSGTAWKLFINGVSEATASGSYNIGSQLLYIGCYDTSALFFQGYISNTRVVKGSAVYTSNFTPSTTPLTPITNTSLLTCQSNRFIDNSNNALALTISGTPTIQRFSPFNPASLIPTSYGGYFDGTGDYLSAASSSAFNVGTNSFCIEFWIYTSGFPSGGVADGIVSAGYSTNVHILGFNVTSFRFYVVGSFVDSTTAINLNAWNHVAFVRNGTTGTIYVNGVASGTGTLSGTGANSALYVGTSSHDLTETFTGYLSNVRFVNGSAVYTSNFTPPTSPLTAISGTSLLTCQSPTFVDNSTNNFTITANGNSQPTTQNPFGSTSATTNGYTVSTIGGSGYFDGSGDSLQAPSSASISGTGDFTAECWIYPTTVPGTYNVIGCSDTSGGLTMFGLNSNGTIFMGRSLIDVQATTSNSLSYNTWNHIAISRSSGTVRLFINGIQGYSGSITTNYNAGTVRLGTDGGGSSLPYAGYISNFRIITNSAIYTSNFVPSLTPLTAVQNTTLLINMTNAGIYDASTLNNIETVGDARLSTAVTKWGATSLSFDGSGDRLVSPPSPINILSSGDFTIEFWLYPSNTSVAYRALVSSENYPATTGGWSLYQNGTAIEFWMNGSASAIINATSAITAGTWQHLALCRASGTLRLFKDGTSISSVSHSTSMTGQQIWIGDNNSSGGGLYFYNGYIDDLRITRGLARYTANFTPPIEAFQIK